ncbi:hypothetical protein QEZ54_25445 [Catellatospora sp. KI3]|uniref:hypothetical protein n=1 Tax=Catellatospora sp. KI3 TaxID=3041620 RepID=UPI0024822FAC|nr:hypothetical protein [Catellatospora sp. KI3]MDI1464321.1 hypothetical protein [Catellatospora sp. KI3]
MTEGNDPTRELRLDATQQIPTEVVKPQQAGFKPGVAAIPAQRQVDHTASFEPTLPPGRIVTSGALKRPVVTLSVRLRQLRVGGRWSVAGAVFLIVCWGLWSASSSDGDHASATLALVLALAVGIGLFGLSRLVGSVVLEKLMGRTRRGAWASHATVGLFLVIVGFSYLSQIEWVVDAWNFLRGVR